MKKALKFGAFALGFLVFLLIIGSAYISLKGIPSYPVEGISFKASMTPDALARGEKLASMLCAGCHYDETTGKLTGSRMLDAPPEFGEIYSPNITGDPTYGIGEWTDGELLFLLRTGIKRDGKYAPPYMAKLAHMADEDIDAIISFLRSDHPLIAADPTPDQPSKPSLLTKVLCQLSFKPFPMPTAPISMPDTSNSVELGQYLAHNLDCFSCHSADFKTVNFLEPEKSEGFYAGGNNPLDKNGKVMPTPNLTPDEETGIGKWTKEEFIAAVKYGRIEGEHALRYPMAPYVLLTDREAGAIYDYLRTIPPLKNKVDRADY